MASSNESMNASSEVMNVITTPTNKSLVVEEEAVEGGFIGLSMEDLQFITNNPLLGN
jgi:hypothetical protein